MTKPNEITEELLRDKLRRASQSLPPNSDPIAMEDHFAMWLKDFIGIVAAARNYERNRCAKIARAHKHHMTAQQILKKDGVL